MNGEKEYILPRADAVVDPHRADCEYPFKGLCGAAVAYKLVEALYNVMQRDPEDVDYLMENVAIATVGDVMDLTGENRIFVKQGLEMLKRTQNPGLKALIECTGVDVDRLNAYHIGFVLGPCINASGTAGYGKEGAGTAQCTYKKGCGYAGGGFESAERQQERDDREGSGRSRTDDRENFSER